MTLFRQTLRGSLLILTGISFSLVHGQEVGSVGVGGGIGVTIVRAVDVVDYINTRAVSSERQDDFSTGAEFFGTSEVRLSESWGLKFEYAYLLKSYTINQGGLGAYDYTYRVHLPSVMAQYIIDGEGYVLKFGGGGGYDIATFSETLQGAVGRAFKSSGVGFKVEAEANTSLGGALHGFFSADIRGAFLGALKDYDGVVLRNPLSQKDVSMAFFGVGLKFGLIYYL